MRIDLLASGLTALQAQAASPSNKLTVTRFDMGDGVGFTYSSSMTTAQGSNIIHGTLSDIRYYPLNADQAAIQCNVNPTKPFQVIVNYVIFVSLNGTEYPFAMCQPHDPLVYNVHLNQTTNLVGTDLYCHAMLSIPGLTSRFDFSNLTMDQASFLVVATPSNIPQPFSTLHDHMFLFNHPDMGRPVHAVNRGNQWWGCQLARQMGDTKIMEISGGASGDGFLYGLNVES